MITPTGSETALLIVHLQPDIISLATAFGALFNAQATARHVVENTNRAMAAVRQTGGLVVPLRIAFAPDYSDLNPSMPLLAMVAETNSLKDGTADAALVPDLLVQDTDPVITHRRPGPFTDSGLQDLLDSRGITTVLVCGVATNASVEGAVRQAADLGYVVSVLPEACSAADAGAHEASLASMQLLAGSLTLSEVERGLASQL